MKISKVIIVINRTKPHARQTASALKTFLDHERVRQEWIETLAPRKNLFRKLADLRDRKVDLVIAVGGDGTLLQAAHRFRGSGLPILGINIGYLGFITSVRGDRVRQEMKRVLNAEFVISQRTALDTGTPRRKEGHDGLGAERRHHHARRQPALDRRHCPHRTTSAHQLPV